MRLTLPLRWYRYKRARGSKDTGKHQEPHLIRFAERKKFMDNLLQECTNEMWLTRPYLTREQERSLSTKYRQSSKGNPLVCTDRKSEFAHKNMKYRINIKPNVTFEERWSHLKVTEKWKPFQDHHTKREFYRYALAAIPSRYPDFYPPAKERWEEWNKVEGFGLKNTNQEKPDEQMSKSAFTRDPRLGFNIWNYYQA
ncbi:uncharacterized protein LOC143449168 [Clavelina lepadiformis]|uniref:uncharacterized protein LOC143449168 n=1 Tax=Clavelina lepadiformis TaxID=159417 RepID=UPI0040433028